MKLSRFVNNLQNTPLHSSGLAGDGSPNPQSFTEREQLEKQRRLIHSYRDSLIGTQRVERGSVRPGKRPKPVGGVPQITRQEFNAPGGQTFKEPPTRGYNPYS